MVRQYLIYDFNKKYPTEFRNLLNTINISIDILQIIPRKIKNDEIICNMKKEIKTNDDPYSEKANFYRARSKYKIFTKLSNKYKPKSVLDFGGNRGDTVAFFGKKFELSKENMISVDVLDWSGRKWKPRDDITFIESKNVDEIPNKSIDLILNISYFASHKQYKII